MATLAGEVTALEVDEKSWDTLLGRAERWFRFTETVQTGFRKILEDTLPKMQDPHLRQYLTQVLEGAKVHEEKAAQLLRLIGRESSGAHVLGGVGLAKARELWADVQGLTSGAVSGWRDLQQVVHASLDGIAVFGVANDLGLALGLSSVTEITLNVMNEKFVHHYLLQELVLELGTISVLYRSEI